MEGLVNQDKTPVSFLKTKETMAIAVADRYCGDEKFRNLFDHDPKAAFAQYLDIDRKHWPPDMGLVILRNDDKCMHIGVPASHTDDNAEISDSDLDNLSGGSGYALYFALWGRPPTAAVNDGSGWRYI